MMQFTELVENLWIQICARAFYKSVHCRLLTDEKWIFLLFNLTL